MSGKIHTFIIEIPRDLELTPEEIADLEGRFQEDAGIIVEKKEGDEVDGPFVNIGAVRVITRLQPEAVTKSDSGPPSDTPAAAPDETPDETPGGDTGSEPKGGAS